jgi:S1-C subfamily serine protease
LPTRFAATQQPNDVDTDSRFLLLWVVSIALVWVVVPSTRSWLDRQAHQLFTAARRSEVGSSGMASREDGERAGAAPSFAEVAVAANPAVVNVSGIRKATLVPPEGVLRLPKEGGSPDDSMNLFHPPTDAPVVRKQVQASGFAIRRDGTIITSREAVVPADEVIVRFPSDPHRYKAQVVASDAPSDVAVVRVADRSSTQSLAFGRRRRRASGIGCSRSATPSDSVKR